MLKELIDGLTREQMQALKELGVPQPRVSEWKHGKGIPSRRAVLALAEVTGADPMEIEREVMALELKPEERAFFQRLLKIPAGALGMLLLSLGMATAPGNSHANQRLGSSPDASRNVHIVDSK